VYWGQVKLQLWKNAVLKRTLKSNMLMNLKDDICYFVELLLRLKKLFSLKSEKKINFRIKMEKGENWRSSISAKKQSQILMTLTQTIDLYSIDIFTS